jgi:GNAT superfamily N-acetyltransferase
MKILTARNQNDLELFFPLLLELRPHLKIEEFFNIYKNSHEQNQFELVGFFSDDDKLIGLMGYRILYDFVRGRHLYIDDLVTSENKRSLGLGTQMLDYAETKARELLCTGGLRLCAGIDNIKVIKFYEKNGWKARAHAFIKKI